MSIYDQYEEREINTSPYTFEERIERELQNQDLGEENSSTTIDPSTTFKLPYLKRSDARGPYQFGECELCKKCFNGSYLDFHKRRCQGARTQCEDPYEENLTSWECVRRLRIARYTTKHPSSHTLSMIYRDSDKCPKCKKKIDRVGYVFHVRRCCKFEPTRYFDSKTLWDLERARMNAPLPSKSSKQSKKSQKSKQSNNNNKDKTKQKAPKSKTQRELLHSLMKLDRDRFALTGRSFFSTFTIHSNKMSIQKYNLL